MLQCQTSGSRLFSCDQTWLNSLIPAVFMLSDSWNFVIPSGFMQSNIAEFIETGFSSVVIKAVWPFALSLFLFVCLFVSFLMSQLWDNVNSDPLQANYLRKKRKRKKEQLLYWQNHTYLIKGERCTGITSSSSRLSVFYPTVIYTRNRCRVWKNA